MRTPAAISPPAERTVPILSPRDEPTGGGPRTQRVAVDTTPLPAILAGGHPRVRGYDILGVIGSGGMGIVYEARHRELNRRVALKTLRGEGLADPEFRERFRAEAEAIARLQHPNVIQVFEVGTVEPVAGESHPSPFIALEFVDGGSLAARARAPQQPAFVARTVATLARAAHAAHLLGVIHRDLKPANVLLDRDGEPKIADFGIAKQLDTAGSGPLPRTRTGIVMGTPEYMSPEQLEGDTASPSIDIYALGVILYELLTGRVPFKGATFSETMRLTLNQEPVPPHRLQPGVPRDLETICLKCLEKSPKKRYATAEALADDLARWLDGRPILARPLGPAGRAARWARRNPTVAALSFLVLASAVTGLSGVVWSWNRAIDNEKRATDLMYVARKNAQRANDAADENKQAADRERWERYRVSLLAASTALRLHDAATARRALGGAPELHRDWVWELLSAQLDRSLRTLDGPGAAVHTAAYSANGRWVLALAQDGTFVVWDLATLDRRGPFNGRKWVGTFQVSNDGATVAFGTADHEIALVDTRTGAARALKGHTGAIETFRFGPDGTELISSSADRTVRVWHLATGRQTHLCRVPETAKLPLELSPDGGIAGSRWEGAEPPTFWDVRTGATIRALGPIPEPVQGYAFSPDGTRVLANGMFPHNVMILYDLATGEQLAVLRGHDNQVSDARFGPNGDRLASCSMDRTVRLWDIGPEALARRRPGQPLELEPRHVLDGHTGWIQRVAFTPDGSRLLSVAYDGTLRYWDARTGKSVAVLRGHSAGVLSGSFYIDHGLDKELIASHAADGTVRLWDLRAAENGYALRGHGSYVYGAAFFPDGDRIASSAWDGTARVWDARTGREVLKLDHGARGIVSSVAVDRDGKLLATLCRWHGEVGNGGGVRLWDADTGALLHTWPLRNADYRDSRVAFSPDGKRLASGAPDGKVRVWDVASRKESLVLAGHPGPVRDVAFSPDGKRLATAGAHGEGTVRVWDAGTGRELARCAEFPEGVNALAWHPAGSLLAVSSADCAVRLYDTAANRTVATLPHASEVHGLTFSPDGGLLACGSADNLVYLWDVGTHREVAELSGHRMYVHAVAFSPDGKRLVSASGDKTVRIWDSDPQRAKAARMGGPTR